jgi:SpoVK/Ycf46/Vps4 family AAA+-type ATPase
MKTNLFKGLSDFRKVSSKRFSVTFEFLFDTIRRLSNRIVGTNTNKDAENENLFSYGGIALVFYGFYNVLHPRYREQFLFQFFQTNLPAFIIPSQKLEWETFRETGLRELSICKNSSKDFTIDSPSQASLVPLGEVKRSGRASLDARTPVSKKKYNSLFENPPVKEIELNGNFLKIQFQSPWHKIKKQEFVGFFPILEKEQREEIEEKSQKNNLWNYSIQKPSFFTDFGKKREKWSSIAARKLLQWPELTMNQKKTNKVFIHNSQKVSFFLKNRALISLQSVNNDSYPVVEKEKTSKSLFLEKKDVFWKQNIFWFLDEIPCKIDSFPELDISSVSLPDTNRFIPKELVGENLDFLSKEYLSIPCIEVNFLPQKIFFPETKVSEFEIPLSFSEISFKKIDNSEKNFSPIENFRFSLRVRRQNKTLVSRKGEPEPKKSNRTFRENSRLNSKDILTIETLFFKHPKNYENQLLDLNKNFISFDNVASPVWPIPKDWNKNSLVLFKNRERKKEFLTTFKDKDFSHTEEKGVDNSIAGLARPLGESKEEWPSNSRSLSVAFSENNVFPTRKKSFISQIKAFFFLQEKNLLEKTLNDSQIGKRPWIGIVNSMRIENSPFGQRETQVSSCAERGIQNSNGEEFTRWKNKLKYKNYKIEDFDNSSNLNKKSINNFFLQSKSKSFDPSIVEKTSQKVPLPWSEIKYKDLKRSKDKSSLESFKKEFGIVFTSSRLMSGYLWPDMKKNDILSAYTSLAIKCLSDLKSPSGGQRTPLIFDLNEKLLLQPISILIPSSFTIPSSAKIKIEKKPIFHLSYKRSEFPGFRYIKALLENSNFPSNAENIANLAQKMNLEEKKNLNTGSDWWWMKWFKKGIFFILRQNSKERLLYVGPVVARPGESATLLFQKNNLVFFEQWVEKFQRFLGSEQDSFFGEPKILVGEIPVERENLEFPSEYLKTLEGELLPFGDSDKTDFLSRFEPLRKSTEIAFDEITVPFSVPLLSMKQKGKIPELTLYEWYNLLRLEMESELENQKNLEDIEFHLPNIIVAETKTSDIFSPFTFFNYQSGGAPLYSKAKDISVKRLSSKKKFLEKNSFKNVENIVSFLMFDSKNNLVLYSTKPESGWSRNFLFQKPWTGKLYQTKTEKNELNFFPIYTTNILPWATEPVNGLSKNICFANGNYEKIATHFGKKRFWFNPIDQLLKFSSETLQLEEPFQEHWEPMTISSWMIIYKLVYILWIQESLKILYRRYGKEILGNLVSIFAALGFDMSEIIEFLELNHTDSGLRVIEKSRKDFADIAGMDHMLPELSEFVWSLRTKGTLPMFQNSTPSLKFSDLSSSLLIVRPFLFSNLQNVGKESVDEKKRQDFMPNRKNLFWNLENWRISNSANPTQISYGSKKKKDERLKFKKWVSKPLSPFFTIKRFSDTNTLKIKNLNKSSKYRHNHFKNLNEFEKSKGKFFDAPTLFIPPKGTLLVGPPGTGKTFLVQAVAGEANVPVVIQSASALMELDQKQSPSQLLKKLFDKARELSPCILFIDEVDTLGSSRENVLLDSSLTEIGNDPSMESFLSIGTKKENKTINGENSLIVNTSGSSYKGESLNSNDIGDIDQSTGLSKQLLREAGGEMASGEVLQSHERKSKISKQQLAILMQFLVEMDGLKKLSGVLLIGATNRPSVLDPAFVRPGRFEKTIRLEIPNKQKRIEILKHYSKTLGFESGIDWDYLANRTAGFTAADISSAMNQSSINAILQKLDSHFSPKHTVDTVEKGIEAISRERGNRTLSSLESKILKKAAPFETQNFLVNRTKKGKIENLENFLSQKELDLSSFNKKKEREKQIFKWGSMATPFYAERGLRGGEKKESHWTAFLTTNLQIPTPFASLVTQSEEGKSGRSFFEKGANLEAVGPMFYSKKDIIKDPFFLTRFAFYQAGKATLQPFFHFTNKIPIFSLSNYSSPKLDFISKKEYINQRSEWESQIINCYAGKASELLALGNVVPLRKEKKKDKEKLNFKTFKKIKNRVFIPNQSNFAILRSSSTRFAFPGKGLEGKHKISKFAIQNCNKSSFFKNSLYRLSNHWFKGNEIISSFKELWASSLGLDDLKNGTLIAHFLVEEWYLYSRKIASSNVLPINKNKKEISDSYVLDSIKDISFKHKEEMSNQYISEERNQEFIIPTWWQLEVTKNYDVADLSFGEWYRIFLSDPEEGERNEEWVAPDEHYNAIETLQNFSNFLNSKDSNFEISSDKSCNYACKLNHNGKNENSKSLVTSNDFKKLIRDYIFYGLVSNGFNAAFNLLHNNREILDLVADCLVRFEKIREPEIANFSVKFFSDNFSQNKKTENLKPLVSFCFPPYAKQGGDKQKLDFQEFSAFRNPLQPKEKTLFKNVNFKNISSPWLSYEERTNDLGTLSSLSERQVYRSLSPFLGVRRPPLFTRSAANEGEKKKEERKIQDPRTSLEASLYQKKGNHRTPLASFFFEKKKDLRTAQNKDFSKKKNLLKDQSLKEIKGKEEIEPWWGQFSRKPYKRLIGLDTIRRI